MLCVAAIVDRIERTYVVMIFSVGVTVSERYVYKGTDDECYQRKNNVL